MKRLFQLLAFLAICTPVSIASAASTENFGFAVQADDRLTLTIAGYNKHNERIFKEVVSRRQVQDSKRYYIILIDEDVIFSNQPIKMICVEDPSGKWSILPVGGTVACDTKPKDTRGTYFFVGRTFPDAASLPGDSNRKAIVCVQDELNALGFDAGAADGVLGGNTQQAATAYVQFTKQKDAAFVMPAVTADNARMWCETVAEKNPVVARFWTAIK